MRVRRIGGLVHRTTGSFRVIEKRGRFYVECLHNNYKPRVKRIGRDTARSLVYEIHHDFDYACVFLGVGVWFTEPEGV